MANVPEQAEMERAALERDDSFDSLFYPAARTTGIFCRPSCGEEERNIKNLQFFPTARAALFAGYRPCLRCKPLEDKTSSPIWVSQLLYAVEAQKGARLTDTSLRGMGLEPERVRRYFVERYGMTFHAYQRARRLASPFTEIREGAGLPHVVSDGPSSGGVSVVLAWIETPMGPMLAGATPEGICLLEFADRRMLEKQMEILRSRFRCSTVSGTNAHIERLRSELAEYFDGKRTNFTVPLEIRGTPFQERVWRLLLEIPCGATWSYEELAQRAGNPAAVRAVARANGMNRIGILIPCHRVVNKNGQLGGYGGGLWRKTALLELEAGAVSRPACVRSA